MHISIVIPSLNQRNFLAQTLQSVLQQRGSFQLSVHVVDGNSSDGTVQLLESLTDPRLIWTSKPDDGQSDAVNNGLSQVRCDVVGWLNSDDLYLPDTLAKVATEFEKPQTQWLVGRCEIIDSAGAIIRRRISRYKNQSLDRYTYRGLLRENFISQPAVFWRRDFGTRVGLLDSTLHYTMDYDLWLRMGRECAPVIHPDALAQFRIHAASKSGAVNREQFDEGFRVACRYFGNDRLSRRVHQFNVEKIVLAYRCLRLLGV